MSAAKKSPDDLQPLRCVDCHSPRLEYRAHAKIERPVLGIYRIQEVQGVDVVAIADESEDDEISLHDESFCCLNCHRMMTREEILANQNVRNNLIFDFMSNDEFNNLDPEQRTSVEEDDHESHDQEDH